MLNDLSGIYSPTDSCGDQNLTKIEKKWLYAMISDIRTTVQNYKLKIVIGYKLLHKLP